MADGDISTSAEAQSLAGVRTVDPLEHRAQIAKRLVKLHARLNARQGRGNHAYKENCEAIKAEITRLEKLAEVHKDLDL